MMEPDYRRKFGRHARPAYRRQAQNLISVKLYTKQLICSPYMQ